MSRPKRKPPVLCAICSSIVLKHQRKTCSRECFSELNRRISVERYRSGKAKIITGNVGIKGHYYKEIYLRSNWELAFAKYLDNIDVKWEYETKRFDLVDSIYICDFYLPKLDMHVEIKGWAKEEFIKKMGKMEELYPTANLFVIQRPPPYDWFLW